MNKLLPTRILLLDVKFSQTLSQAMNEYDKKVWSTLSVIIITKFVLVFPVISSLE